MIPEKNHIILPPDHDTLLTLESPLQDFEFCLAGFGGFFISTHWIFTIEVSIARSEKDITV
jgi:hypothetical protein